MLEVSDLHAGYGPVQVLRGVSLSVNAGEVLCLLGRNGAGKTTTLKSIMGLLPVSHGHVSMQGTVLSDMPAHKIPGEGIGYIPQGRRLFPQLSVAENIEMGLMAGGNGEATREWVLDLAPRSCCWTSRQKGYNLR